MATTIYQDGNYTVTGSADGRTYRVTISNGAKSQGINFFPLGAAGKTEISRNLPSGMVAQFKKMKLNPAEYAICNGALIRMAAVDAIEAAVAAWQASGEIPAPPALPAHIAEEEELAAKMRKAGFESAGNGGSLYNRLNPVNGKEF